MPSTNITLDNVNPRIVYSPQWTEGDPRADTLAYRYSDGGTFKVATAAGATMRFTFTGTAVSIYGAKRSNHGMYSVTLDGEKVGEFSGQADDLFGAELYSSPKLQHGSHTVTLTNQPLSNFQTWVDIDWITYEAYDLPDKNVETVLVQDTDPMFSYTPLSSWSNSSTKIQAFNDSTGHITTQGGASVTCNFFGDAITLWGSIGPDNGQYSVSLDGQPETTFNATNIRYVAQTMIYEANGLGPGNHSIVLTNRPERAGQSLTIDYAVITKIGGRGSGLTTGAIAGLAVGCIVGVMAILGLAFYWFRRKRSPKSPGNEKSGVSPFAAPIDEPRQPEFVPAPHHYPPSIPASASTVHISSPASSPYSSSNEKRPVTLSHAYSPGAVPAPSSTSSGSVMSGRLREPGREMDAGPLPPSYTQATQPF